MPWTQSPSNVTAIDPALFRPQTMNDAATGWRAFLPGRPPGEWLSNAQSLVLDGNTMEARALLDAGHAAYPQDAELALALAGLYLDAHRHDEAEQLLHIKKQMAELIAEHTGQTIDQIEADSDRDRWFTASEAKDYGFVDNVIVKATMAGRHADNPVTSD